MTRKILIAVYTCAEHEYLHPEFYSSAIGRSLSEISGDRFVEVYADPGLQMSCVEGTRLTVATEETYTNLCRKTKGMVSALVEQMDFDYLVKVDVTSGVPAMNQDARVMNRVEDPTVLIDFLDRMVARIESGQAAQYEGWKEICPTRDGIERWADMKDMEVDVKAVFGRGAIPPYYSGKCYALGRDFAEYVARSDNDMLGLFESKLPSEDLLIGCLFQAFMSRVPGSPVWPPPATS